MIKKKEKFQGQAVVQYLTEENAKQARILFHKSIIGKNQISVNPYFNPQSTDQKANIFVNNLPKNTDVIELQDYFSQFGSIVSVKIQKDKKGEQLNYGYVQYEENKDAQSLVDHFQKSPLIYKGQNLQIQFFRNKEERKELPTSIYFRAFSSALPKTIFQNKNIVAAIELGWTLIIKEYFQIKQEDAPISVFVKICENPDQVWATVTFNNHEQANKNYKICDESRQHPCFCLNSINFSQMFNQENIFKNYGESNIFSNEIIECLLNEICPIAKEIFVSNFDNFFFNWNTQNKIEPDPRLLLVHNIDSSASKNQLLRYFEFFGKVVSLSKKKQNDKSNLAMCFVQYQTLLDAENVQNFHNNLEFSEEAWKQKRQIFKNNDPKIQIYLQKSTWKQLRINK